MAILVALLCLSVLALAAFVAAGVLLSAPASEPRPVDAVVVLGGDWSASGVTNRYALGRDLVLAGYSKRLILFYPGTAEILDAQATFPGVEHMTDSMVRNTWDEAEAVRARMQADGGLHSVIVVSDPPHMLRLRYTWGSVFRGTGMNYTLIATSPPWWTQWRWWQNPQSTNFVGNEVLKLGYYLVRYRFGF
jgi:uncharacterized SAM-binding protein YcdF (DUF218 family)